VLSVIFVVIATLGVALTKIRNANELQSYQYQSCPIFDDKIGGFSECYKLLQNTPAYNPFEVWITSFLAAIALWIIIALIVIGTRATVRWILAGRQTQPDID
jgi:hypothetical protein